MDIAGIERYDIAQGDCLRVLQDLPDESVDCCVTSPPYYGLRTYHSGDGEIGQESSPPEYVTSLKMCFREVRRVLRPTGTLWLNLGDTYNGDKLGNTEKTKNRRVAEDNAELNKHRYALLPDKSLLGIPWRVAFALQEDGWVLRSDIIWAKPNPMPTSAVDRCSSSHEYIFMFSKTPSGYFFDYEAIEEPGVEILSRPAPKDAGYRHLFYGEERAEEELLKHLEEKGRKTLNTEKGQCPHTMHKRRGAGIPRPFYEMRRRRDVWSIPVSFNGLNHFATFPEELARLCVVAGCPKDGLVLDPFSGAGTTGVVALKNHRRYLGIELNPKYVALSRERIDRETRQQTLELDDFTR